MVFKSLSCAEIALYELEKDSRSGQDFTHRDFTEIGFSDWKAHSGIPSDDIIWQNVGNLK